MSYDTWGGSWGNSWSLSWTRSPSVIIIDGHDGAKKDEFYKKKKEKLREDLLKAFEIALGEEKTEAKAKEIIQEVSPTKSTKNIDWKILEAKPDYKDWLLNVMNDKFEEEIIVTLLLQ